MDDSQGDTTRRRAAEELILRTIAGHAESLLRTARRHSMCADDAHDAYQRAMEIFMAHATRLDAVRAPPWLHVVIKREAQAIRRSRHKLLLSTAVDLDAHPSDSLTPEERLLSIDMVSRSAEALKQLKPHELQALWLRAEGHSYSDIAVITGWTYTKVNRCVSEGRRSFLEHYAGIESGEACRRWLPVLSALVDGEATAEDLVDLRPHLRNCPACRATLKALQDSSTPLAVLLPVPLLVADGGVWDRLMHVATRLYEAVAGGLHERAANSVTKAQAFLEASAAGKVAAVAASAAAVAGGGYASVEEIIKRPAAMRSMAGARASHASRTAKPALPPPPVAPAAPRAKRPVVHKVASKRNEFGSTHKPRRSKFAPEFRPRTHAGSGPGRLPHAAAATRPAARQTPPPPPPVAPEFAPRGAAPEFTP